MYRIALRSAFALAILVAALLIGCGAAVAANSRQAPASATETAAPANDLAVVRFFVPTVT